LLITLGVYTAVTDVELTRAASLDLEFA